MERLAAVDGLVVQQRKEWGEILTGFETRNSYVVMDTQGNELYAAAEESSVLARLFLKSMRPFEIDIVGLDGQPAMRVRRPFRFYFHEVQVFDADGTLLGTVRRRFSILRRLYSVLNATGRPFSELFGPILHPWTFQIRREGQEYGKITKKWSGLGKEMFTDADNFGVQFPADWEPRLKAIFLGAVFLIDFVHFEDKGRD